jgi:hypothetical protein
MNSEPETPSRSKYTKGYQSTKQNPRVIPGHLAIPPIHRVVAKNRHRRCAAPNLPSFVFLNGVTLATLEVTAAPTALAPPPALARVPDEGEEEGKDDDIDPDRSSIGGKRSLSMSDLRLRVTRAENNKSTLRSGKGKGKD